MKKILVALFVPFCLLVLFTGSAAAGEEGRRPRPDDAKFLLSPEELEDLLAPVALYPDPLLAQLLPAATFTDQLRDAARYVERHGSSARIDRQDWDVSVKAVAHYPELLFMMNRNYPWTVTVGKAFLNQETQVLDAIQRLRREAYETGNLRSTREQQVLTKGNIIRIVPADPVYLYLPQYDPGVVYAQEPGPGQTFVSFGLGVTIGAWLNRDCDWSGHRIYYHGWRDRGWVSRSRPHVQTGNRAYVGRSAQAIHVDRTVSRRDNRSYREELQRGAAARAHRQGETTPASRYRVRRGPQLRPPAEPSAAPPAGRSEPRRDEPATAPPPAPSPVIEPGGGSPSPAPPSSAPPAAPHPVSPGSRAR